MGGASGRHETNAGAPARQLARRQSHGQGLDYHVTVSCSDRELVGHARCVIFCACKCRIFEKSLYDPGNIRGKKTAI